jgi:hypothetical protein
MLPLDLRLILKTQRQPIGFFPGGGETKDHVLFSHKASISDCIALRHSGKFLASVYDFGSDSIAIFDKKER